MIVYLGCCISSSAGRFNASEVVLQICTETFHRLPVVAEHAEPVVAGVVQFLSSRERVIPLDLYRVLAADEIWMPRYEVLVNWRPMNVWTLARLGVHLDERAGDRRALATGRAAKANGSVLIRTARPLAGEVLLASLDLVEVLAWSDASLTRVISRGAEVHRCRWAVQPTFDLEQTMNGLLLYTELTGSATLVVDDEPDATFCHGTAEAVD